MNLDLEERGPRTSAAAWRRQAREKEDRELFATFLSHEIRQPLGSLVLWLDLLESTQKDHFDDDGRRYLQQIHLEVDRLAEMVEEQLVFARVASVELKKEWVSLEDVVRDVLEDLQQALRRIKGRVKVDPLPRVYTDSRLLHPLLRNLVSNAIQYRRPEEPLIIHISSRLPESVPEMECEVLVADNGCGFPAEDAEKIFRMFERLDPDGPPGTGIGLAICQRIAERLGGELTAESQPGEGSVFVLSLPAERVTECDVEFEDSDIETSSERGDAPDEGN